MNLDFYSRLTETVEKKQVLLSEPMKYHTTFRTGGPADYFVTPRNAGQIRSVISLCEEEKQPYFIIGNGSNLLVGDGGYRGVIIRLNGETGGTETDGAFIRAQAGATLAKVGNAALASGLGGFEFASGIPGTVGGAVAMNAGAYGAEICDIIENATVLTREGEVLTLDGEALGMGYRSSAVSRNGYIVLEALFRLRYEKGGIIRANMEELRRKRAEKQPLEYPSAGSTFKRPDGYFAGKLIREANLAGFSVGDAQVSEKHCGFIINRGRATSSDIVRVIRHVADEVMARFGVRLEPEIKFLGDFE